MKSFLVTPQKKYKKYHKARAPKGEYKNTSLTFGVFGLKSLENKLLTACHLETFRKTVLRIVKKKAKLIMRLFPDIPVTKKPLEIRMGKGKGSVSHWVAKVGRGQIIGEIASIFPSSITEDIMFLALIEGGRKLPIKFKVLKLKI